MEKTTQKKSKFSVRDITAIALMAALVFVATNIKIDIPTPLGKTMIHCGNVVCVLGGLLFGGLYGGLAAGIGSAIFDLLDPIFAPEFWITFIMKFIMAYVAGKIANSGTPSQKKIVISSITGILLYKVVYTVKEVILHYFILKSPWETVIGVIMSTNLISIVSMGFSIITTILLYNLVAPALYRAGVIKRYAKHEKKDA